MAYSGNFHVAIVYVIAIHYIKYARLRVFTESTILSLYGKIRVSENPYSHIFYVVILFHKCQTPQSAQKGFATDECSKLFVLLKVE